MRYFFASDIHGDFSAARLMLEAFKSEGAARLLLLGDLLYHGPRNHICATYDPRGVSELLNGVRDKICAVRGNCDAEVDQMMLDFPIMADYAVLPLASGTVYLTHGHLSDDRLPRLQGTDLLITGHTHIAGVSKNGKGTVCLNPGSVSLPKGDTPACYMIYDAHERTFFIRRLADGSEFLRYSLEM